MLCAGLLSIVVLSLASIPVCLADISLIVPGFDPQPLSVNIVGVGADGETTYQMLPGQPTGTWVGQDPAFIGTATLVEGADNAMWSYANSALSITMVESCTFANGVADCVDVIPGQTTVTTEEPATPMLVQGGGTALPAAGSGVPAQTTPAPSGAATQAAPSSSISASSGGVRLTPARGGLAGVLAILAVMA